MRWESSGEGSFTVETVNKSTRGTDITLHLRSEEDELLSGYRLREILRTYSDHIAVPIVMKKERWDADAKKQVLTDEDEQVNRASALWMVKRMVVDGWDAEKAGTEAAALGLTNPALKAFALQQAAARK